jgi:hypothetical protein
VKIKKMNFFSNAINFAGKCFKPGVINKKTQQKLVCLEKKEVKSIEVENKQKVLDALEEEWINDTIF